jgi:hypothetical protein
MMDLSRLTVPALLQVRFKLFQQAQAALDKAAGEGRALTVEEDREIMDLLTEARRVDAVYREERKLSGATGVLHPVQQP